MEKNCFRGPEYGVRPKTNSCLFFLWIVKFTLTVLILACSYIFFYPLLFSFHIFHYVSVHEYLRNIFN